MLGDGWGMEWMGDTSQTVMNTTFTFTYQFYHQDGDDQVSDQQVLTLAWKAFCDQSKYKCVPAMTWQLQFLLSAVVTSPHDQGSLLLCYAGRG